jgi:ApbE superfamily uncharacterized protein (UPF0280 family)
MLDARRLHLQHGPIDLIVEAFGPDWQKALTQAEARFQTVLTGLVAELDLLRAPLGTVPPTGPVAVRMAAAVAPFRQFLTPMAAVAGAVADEVLAALVTGCRLDKAYVNNGGDIAVWLAEGQELIAAVHDCGDAGRVRLMADQAARGIATSGWRGRSHSLGIADAVTVVARDAAAADVAATLIANAVDLPGHPLVKRAPASDLSPDSDLGARPVTVDVGPLDATEIQAALAAGQKAAAAMLADGLIAGAALFLADQTILVGAFPTPQISSVSGGHDARFQTA